MSIGVVQTQYGRVKGVEHTGKYEGITEFRGIPYAAPPVGDLRWAPPREPRSWTDVRVCDTYAPAAIQTFLRGARSKEIYYLGFPERSEDCLYLNVITGASEAKEKRPVYIWYHDGGLTNGYSHGIEVNPLELVRQGIVVVQVGHRLGAFGYIALPQLTREYGHSGNYGVLDTVKAFLWVYNNIENFGGDPEHITIGGQSGGTNKCCTLVQMPELKGKIRGVINQSGLKWLYEAKTQQEADAIGADFLAKSGIDPDTPLEKLRQMDTFEIYKDLPVSQIPGDLVLDGVVLKQQFSDGLLESSAQINYMNSLCVGEADVFAATTWATGTPFATKDEFYAHFRTLLGPLYDRYNFETLIDVTDENAWTTALRLASYGLAKRGRNNISRNLMANRIFSAEVARRYPDSKVFTYVFSHLLPKRSDLKQGDPVEYMAPHGSDLWYAYASFSEGTPPVRPWRECDYEVAKILNGYFVNFIKNGDPNGRGLPKWPVGGENFSWLDLDTEPKAHVGLEGALDELIYEFVTNYYNI